MKSRIGTLGFLATLSALGLSVAGCTHGTPAPESAASARSTGTAPDIASGHAASSGAVYGPPPSAAPASPAEEGVAKADSERPGLGTSWGESVSSHVTSTTFYRQSESSPDGLASLFYN